MTKERDINNKIVAEVNGYQIIKSETKNFDKWTQEFSGHTKVYYDVCDDVDLIDSFKTLKQAKAYAETL